MQRLTRQIPTRCENSNQCIPFIAASIWFVAGSLAFAAGTPTQVKGQVLDETGKPISGVQIVIRARESYSPFPELPEEVARGVSGPMGHFLIRMKLPTVSNSHLTIAASHPDYEGCSDPLDDSDDLVIRLSLHKPVLLAQLCRDEKDAEQAVERAIDLLQGDERRRWTPYLTCRVYRHIGSIRKPLRAVATSGKWEKPVAEGLASPGYRARMLLAYWGHERDAEILRLWLKEYTERRREENRPIAGDLQPKSQPAKTINQAIANWLTHTKVDNAGAFTAIDGNPSSGHILVHHIAILPDSSHHWHVIFVRRDSLWHPLFHRQP